jgi:hypothetical protein
MACGRSLQSAQTEGLPQLNAMGAFSGAWNTLTGNKVTGAYSFESTGVFEEGYRISFICWQHSSRIEKILSFPPRFIL